jgi:lipopolysaccharide transport system permease protein
MFRDFISALKCKDLWVYLAWYDVVAKYRRTSLGPFWSIIITAVSILCMAGLGSILFKINIREFLPYVACGMVVWAYMNAIIMDSCGVFLQSASLLQNVRLPILAFTFRMFLRNTILFLHSLVILFAILIFTSRFSFSWLYILPAFLVFGINAISLSIILGFFSARYRDIIHMVQAILSIVILLTPIMWKVEMLGEYSYLAYANPFTHYIALFRNPLLGQEISSLNYLYVTIATILNLIVARYLYNRFKNRLVFWL